MTTFYVIENTNSVPLYFDEKMGRDFGAPHGGWNPDQDAATRFKSEHEAQQKIERLGHMAPFCEVRPYTLGRPEAARAAESKRPRYRLTTQAYINDQLLEPGAEITYLGVPGPHFQPINEAAQAKWDEAYPLGTDPLANLAEALSLASLYG